MKLYTKTGDDGSTGLFGSDRVGKDHPRIEAIGTVDELNASLGLVGSELNPEKPLHQRLLPVLRELQSRLFNLGADLATPVDSKHGSKIKRISTTDVAQLEQWIDEFDKENDELTQFILPGGTELAARLHVSRGICRRAERRVINLSRSSEVNDQVIIYLNRISDLLFALARRVNKDAGVADVPWEK